MSVESQQAPPDLGAGQQLKPTVKLDDVIALWGCATERKEVPDIPGAEGRTILSYRFPTKRLIGLYEDGSEPTPRPMSALAFHFDKKGSLIFFEELEEGNLPIAIGGNLVGVEVKPGPGHFRGAGCD